MEKRCAAPDPVGALAGQGKAPQVCLHHEPGEHPRGVHQHPGRPVDADDAMSRLRELRTVNGRAAPKIGDVRHAGQAGREGGPQIRE